MINTNSRLPLHLPRNKLIDIDDPLPLEVYANRPMVVEVENLQKLAEGIKCTKDRVEILDAV